MRRLFPAGALASLSLVFAAPAAAQVHIDVGGEAGIMRRALSSQAAGASDAGFGPMFEIHAHAALLPLVRVGAYLSHDISPISGFPARQLTSGGLHLRIASPWPTRKWHGWLFAGLGYATVYERSYSSSFANPNTGVTGPVFVDGAAGSFWEVPLGVAIAYKLAKPLELTASLGMRLGFDFSGDAYTGASGHTAGLPPLQVGFPGNDTFAAYASVGVNFEL